MSASVMSAFGATRTTDRESIAVEVRTRRPVECWSPETFAREQIRGLVRQIFSPNAAQQMRQVVFSGIESDTDVSHLCRRVGETLAEERIGEVAIVGAGALFSAEGRLHDPPAEYASADRSAPFTELGTRVRRNCWLVPAAEYSSAESLLAFLAAIRREFESSVVEAPPTAESGQAMMMAQFADGFVLVLSAQNTRRASARRIKQAVEQAQVRLLGTVLSDREFPIPEALYRRL